ncbi:protein phosphatase 1 regulatory subunit 1B isoform X1 [Pezoporus occidentalis]|uniref:protein phosphatase 1 regulatory subunit 1B isoform X1 n=1 Tax=Pezoporus occidentalis TaxID=407982 RepID=UPI002F919B1E
MGWTGLSRPRRTGAPGATELPARYRRLRPPVSGDHGPQGPQEDPVLGAGPPQPAGPPRRGDEDESLPYQRESCLLKPKRTNPCAYTPPSLKAVQRIVQSHLEGGLAGGDSSDGEADDGEHELARACDPDSALEPAPGSQARAERSYFSGPKAHKRKGGQKVSFAGGIEERGQDLKSLTVSEIPEDPEGLEEEEEEDGGTGERRHVGFAEVPSRPIGTERHSPTYPLGTS